MHDNCVTGRGHTSILKLCSTRDCSAVRRETALGKASLEQYCQLFNGGVRHAKALIRGQQEATRCTSWQALWTGCKLV
jgi:hypothetical protein